MKAFIIILIFLSGHNFTSQFANKDENTRYILIEAPCKPGFPALPEAKEKVIKCPNDMNCQAVYRLL